MKRSVKNSKKPDGKTPKPRSEHHVLLVIHSADTYINVLTKAVAGAAQLVDGTVEGHGVDHRKEAAKLATFVEERNLAVAECHRLRCELEAVRSDETLVIERDAARTECERLQDYITQLHETISDLKHRDER